MLEAERPFGAPVRPFVAAHLSFALAAEPWQRRGYWALRRAIFCAETGLFASDGLERDAHDAHALPIVALAHCAGTPDEVVGVVRIFDAGGGCWYGGRLGVARRYRANRRVGTGLINTAVGGAKALRCRCFLATVLHSNRAYFERHHFRAVRELTLCGRPHVLMRAELSAFASQHLAPAASLTAPPGTERGAFEPDA